MSVSNTQALGFINEKLSLLEFYESERPQLLESHKQVPQLADRVRKFEDENASLKEENERLREEIQNLRNNTGKVKKTKKKK